MTAARTQMQTVRPERLETVFELTLHDWEVMDGYSQLQLLSRRRMDCESFRVDWGDGTVDTVTTLTQQPLWHNYRSTGTFRVVFDGGLAWFRLAECFAVDSSRRCYVVRPDVHPVQWGDRVLSARSAYAYWNGDGHGNTGVWGRPLPWGKSMTDVSFCYACSKHIVGRLPHWTPIIADATCTFQLTGVTGRILRWPKAMTRLGGCYCGCTGVYGRIPPWPEGATNCSDTFANCPGVEGSPPAWPETLTDAARCYSGCSTLTGKVPAWPDGVDDIQECYMGCTGLAGAIPAWGAGMLVCQSAYRGCTGLDSAWTDDPAELMPTRPHWTEDCVRDTTDSLRALFTAAWGGTKGEE